MHKRSDSEVLIDKTKISELVFFCFFLPKIGHFKAPNSWNIREDTTSVSSADPARPQVCRMRWANHTFRSSALKSLQTSQRSVSFRAAATYPTFIPWRFDLIWLKCLRGKRS